MSTISSSHDTSGLTTITCMQVFGGSVGSLHYIESYVNKQEAVYTFAMLRAQAIWLAFFSCFLSCQYVN